MSMENMKSLRVSFDMHTGLSPEWKSIRRNLSAMEGIFADETARAEMAAQDDVLVYEFYDSGRPESPGEVAFGTSITYPGRVGDEYFMTKGHFHTVRETAEVYYCLRGHGFMLMEGPDGDWEAQELTACTAVYVPEGYAHRSINVSDTDPLITFYAFRADAGHDYGTIETAGFRKLIVERNGKPTIIDSPRWRDGAK